MLAKKQDSAHDDSDHDRPHDDEDCHDDDVCFILHDSGGGKLLFPANFCQTSILIVPKTWFLSGFHFLNSVSEIFAKSCFLYGFHFLNSPFSVSEIFVTKSCLFFHFSRSLSLSL